MEERHEIIQFDSGNPLKIFMHKLGDVSRHWHESMELLLVLAGQVSVITSEGHTLLSKDDLLLINSNTAHELHAEECVLIAVQIKLSKFNLPQEQIQSLYFDCNSTTQSTESPLRIKQLIATMLQANVTRDGSTDLYNFSLAYSLLTELVRNFRVKKPTAERNVRRHLDRMNSIVHYINEHYQEHITLAMLSEQEHLSIPYLSSFFEKYMGMNFSTYYTSLRLEHATRALLCTEESVEDIALNNGFSDSRSFVRAFKKKYGMIPSVYRRNAGLPKSAMEKDPLLSINYLEFQPENYLHMLSDYLNEAKSPSSADPHMERTYAIGTVDYQQGCRS